MAFFSCMHADETKVHTVGEMVKARRDGHYPFIALFAASLLNIPYYHRHPSGATYAAIASHTSDRSQSAAKIYPRHELPSTGEASAPALMCSMMKWIRSLSGKFGGSMERGGEGEEIGHQTRHARGRERKSMNGD